MTSKNREQSLFNLTREIKPYISSKNPSVAFIEANNNYSGPRFISLNTPNFEMSPSKRKEIKGEIFIIPPLWSRTYIYATSGYGKSTWCANYIGVYHKFYPDNKVYLISHIEEDRAFNNMDYIKKLDIDYLTEYFDGNYNYKDFQNSLLVFDDVLELPKYDGGDIFRKFQQGLLKLGRHFNISILITSHGFNDGMRTKVILAECDSFVLFPRMRFGRNVRQGIKKYLNINDLQFDKIKTFAQGSRWVYLKASYPEYWVFQYGYMSKID